MTRILMICAVVTAIPIYAQTDSAEVAEPRIGWQVEAISEGQWNMSNGSGNWANMLSVRIDARTWRGGTVEMGALATGHLEDGVVDDLQDFSNINAENRIFRLTHFGIGQRFASKFYVFAGLRQADEDYFNTDGAGIFTGSSYGCAPQIGENLCAGVYPEAALGVHLEYQPTEAWLLRASLYNGVASDRLNRQFRFRPGHDGMVNLGSVSYSPTFSSYFDSNGELAEGFLAPNYVIGYAADWQHHGGAVWASADQPLVRVGRAGLNLFAMGGVHIGQFDAAHGHWSAALILDNVTQRGGTLAMGVSQAHYAGRMHETDFETTFEYPIFSWFSLQPALHVIRTGGETNVVGNLRLNISLGNL